MYIEVRVQIIYNTYTLSVTSRETSLLSTWADCMRVFNVIVVRLSVWFSGIEIAEFSDGVRWFALKI